MGSYEEWVVDREVDAAWLQFRVRLADHLASMGQGDVVSLGLLDADDTWSVELVVTRTGRGHTALWEWADEDDRRHARHGRSIRFGPQKLDAYVQVVRDVLEGAGAVHPSFVSVLYGDLVLVDPPEQLVAPAGEPELPESVTVTGRDDLAEWVERVVTKRLGRPPTKREDGSTGISRDCGEVDIRVSGSRPIVAVWAAVAREVDVRKARKLLPKLNAAFHFFSFSLAGDTLIVSTTVNAKPFCPEHLDRAIDSTFAYLEGDGAKVRAKLARKVAKVAQPVAVSDNAVDPDLLLVYGVGEDRKAMVRLARDLAGDSRTCLGQWRDAAGQAGKVARVRASQVENGPLQNALIEQVIAWRRVASAITDAVEDIAVERESA